MVEKLKPGTSGERDRLRTEIRLAKDLKDAHAFAERTGGAVKNHGKIPWEIKYADGYLLWAGYPEKQPNVVGATPFLYSRLPRKHFNGWIGVEAAICEEDSITLISPGFGHDDVVFGCIFSNGQMREFEIPADQATNYHLKAREMARGESKRFMSNPTPKITQIERG